MKLLKAMVALAALVTVVVVPPILLVAFIGWPVPELRAPLLSDSDVLRLLALAAWALWVQVLWCIAYETNATVRALPLNRAAATFAFQQHAARVLIATVLTGFFSGPALATADAAHAAPRHAAAKPLAERPLAAEPPPATSPATSKDASSVRVSPGDTLWSLAAHHLGDADRWNEIAELNEGREMPDGRTFRSSDVIRPGWVLVLPEAGTASDPIDGRTYVVRSGDTLSAIAEDRLGNASAWPDLFESSRRLEQPMPLVDPNLIYPGQRIDLDVGQVSDVPERSEAAPSHSEPPPGKSGVEPGPAPTAEPTARAPSVEASAAPPDDQNAEEPDQATANWVLPSMAGAGALLAGAMWGLLRLRRTTQQRYRRPGRVMESPTGVPHEVERSMGVVGRSTMGDVEFVDQLLRRLAAEHMVSGRELPDVDAVSLSEVEVSLHVLGDAAPMPPWVAGPEAGQWQLDRSIDLERVGPEPGDLPAPWPLLVVVGKGSGTAWFANLEDRIVTLGGDLRRATDLARFMAAEVVCNPWSAAASVALSGICAELVPMCPERVTFGVDAVDVGRAAAEQNIDRLATSGLSIVSARVAQDDPDLWSSLLVVAGDSDSAGLFSLLEEHPNQTGIAAVTIGGDAIGALALDVDADGGLAIPWVRGRVQAASLTEDEARGCASLLQQAEKTDYAEPDDQDADGDVWRSVATALGSLRREYTVTRLAPSIEPLSSLLPSGNGGVAADGSEDLDAVAPLVSEATRDRVESLDPELDRDLAEWKAEDCLRPRLSLLGSVTARTRGKPVVKRKAYHVEMFAVLALHHRGMSPDQLSDALSVGVGRLRVDMNSLRDWLGTDRVTGVPFLPRAADTPAAQERGAPTYQLVGALSDWELFQRLRVRGEARGAEGIEDLRAALRLVQGEPFTDLRKGGWSWLHGGHRFDHEVGCAIVDVAHVLVSHALSADDAGAAMWAAEAGMRGAPRDEMLLLDYGAALAAQGRLDEAREFLRDRVANRSDDGGPPIDLPRRTQLIMDAFESRLGSASAKKEPFATCSTGPPSPR